MISWICETMRGISPSVGSSRRMILGSSIIARAIASICCSPPDSVPPAWLRRTESTGKVLVNLLQKLLLVHLRHSVAIETYAQIFHDREITEDPPILRNVANPESCHAVGRQ